MLKYWFYGMLAIVATWVLSAGVTLSYAHTPYRPAGPVPPSWDDMPEVAGMLHATFHANGAEMDYPQMSYAGQESQMQDDSLRYPIPQAAPDEDLPEDKSLYIKSNITEEAQYDPKSNEYVLTRKVGDMTLSRRHMTMDEYVKYTSQKAVRDYWKSKADYTPTTSSGLSGLIPGLNLDFLDEKLGKDLIKFDLNGSIGLEFALVGTRRDDPSLDIKHRRTFNFDFASDINVNLNATIADRLKFNISHNTEALFQFDNKFKLEYEGKEDEIVKNISAGNIDFPLNTTLISGVQELFGIKARLQFGKTFITGVFSEQRSESTNVRVEGGAQSTEFDIKVDDYEENRHFFLAQYFRDHYHEALADLPLLNSRLKITKIEVWVTNIGSPVQNNRNILAFTDLGENNPMASNVHGNPFVRYPDQERSNDLLRVFNKNSLRNLNTVGQFLQGRGYTNGREFEKVESARRLDASEYSFNPSLGFITLNQTLNSDQVLAVAFQYQIVGDTAVYQVGEFSDQGINDPQVLVVKLLKSSVLNTEIPLWDLMMKNVYSLNTYQLSGENFRFNIMYSGNERGVPSGYFTDGPRSGIPLIQVFGLDNLDTRQNRNPDGLFDYLDGAATGAGYVQGDKGLIYLPWPEPFGKDMVQMFGGDSNAARPYRYDELYRKTKTEARQYSEKNKYTFVGSYKSSGGSEISLGAYNLPEGSVKVMAGNTPLVENQDYTVNYASGIVQIINPGVLNSGVPIDIKTESRSNSLLTKRMMGLRVEHFFDEHFYVGGTIMNLRQSSLTQKVNYGEEPISNTIYGFDASYDRESRWLTKAVDAILPFEDSKAPSRISLYGEFAHFLPGHSRAIGRSGTTYIDDFESSKSTINLKEPYSWYLASTPQKQDDLFPESADQYATTTITGRNRAKLAWYTVDPIFYSSARPKNITKEDLSNHYTRRVLVNEVFPGRQLSSNEAQTLTVLNMAFYPSERGPYNYDVTAVPGVTAGVSRQDGSLLSPETRWGGMMRKVSNTDFEAANVEYIEFWVMDPFIGTDGKNGNPRHSGGKLYFNLGDISEDVLRDGRKSFEHGLPTSAVVENVDETQWGRVPSIQAIVNSFDNNPASRKFQDVGLDGLSTNDERDFFREFLAEMGNWVGQNSEAYRNIYEDPSSDNYRYFRRGIWDTVQHSSNKIADRYKYYNNPDGNSPSNEDNPESYPTQQTNYPNTEDISGDNTLNEAENYYQYEVELDPDRMTVGEGYITDVYEASVKLSNNTTDRVKWYQFKIPVKEPDKVVGQMQNLQSVRFVRMFMKGFKEPVILRFASLDLVRSDWRKYDNTLLESGETVPGGSQTTFEVSTVNVEENGQRTPIRYVLPPGIERMLDPSDQNNVEMNEQSLSLKVGNLMDGDARGIYKNTSYDMRQFKKMEMFVHMEKVHEMDNAVDGDVHLFVRMGADNNDNYYEYDIPLSYTEWGQSARDLVWPEANKVEIDLGALVKVKERRNRIMREQGSLSYAGIYSEQIGKATYSVKGTPSISAVKTIVIGLRNPARTRPGDGDDGQPKSVEVWINEFSLNEFKKEGGVAATARAQLSLGDLGSISVAGAYTQANFGQIEQKLTDLSQSNTGSYDIAVDLEMGRFVPEKAGLRLPVHYDLSSTISNPKYNPLDPDIKTKDELGTYTGKQEKKAFKKAIQDYTIRQNVNLMNVRKERTNAEKQPQFWDIENFNVSYAYSSTRHRDEDMEFDNQVIHRGGFGYDYSTASRFFTPLGKTKMASNPWAAILTDFNVNYIPNMFSFNMELEREYSESKMRNKNAEWDIIMPSTTYKRFDWSRNYNFRYDLTKSISINYSANANSYLREPPGRINTASRRDSVWSSFIKGGSMTNYDQNLGLTYTLPINKIPVLDWVEGSAAYNALYRWEGGSLATQERLGNVISNSMDVSANGSVNLVGLYNKIPFLKKINDGNRRTRRGGRSNTIMTRANQKEDEPEEKSAWKTLYKGALRFLMMIRDANINYSRNEGTSLPGFMPEPDLFGVNFGKDAPGAGFALFGSQADIRRRAARNGWLSTDSLMTTPYHKQFTESVTAQVSVEPFTDFRITVNFGYNKVENKSSYYTYNSILDDFAETNPVVNGSYNVTNVMIGTAFSKFDKKYFDKTYQKFLDNRIVIAERLAQDNAAPGYDPHVYRYDTAARRNYPQGYMSNNQDVMIPALIAAYTGCDPYKVSLSAMDKFPLPNWSLTYSGLTKIKGVRKVFKNFSISHAYSSSYTVGSYTNNLLYKDAQDFVENIDEAGNFRSRYIMDGIVLSEQFSPLIKINMTFINDLSLNFEYRQSRQIGLSFVNNQITESRTKEWIVGAGYRIKNVGFKVNSGGAGKRRISSDIVLRADFSIRDNIRLLRKIDQQINTPSEGAVITSINVYAEYEITRQLSARVFYDMTLNKPYIANQFYSSNGRGGISLTYKFTQ